MYKKASRLKLRFLSERGPMTIDQLWDIKIGELKRMVITAAETIKKLGKVDDELNFLEENNVEDPELEQAKLRFEILKDVYVTRVAEKREASENAKIDMDIKHLENILAEKEEEKIKNMSVEDLKKLIEEKKLQKK